MIRIDQSKGAPAGAKTDLVGYGLDNVKAFCQREQKIALIIQQYGKEASRGTRANVMGAMDSARFKHRANLALALDFKVSENGRQNVPTPFKGQDGKQILLNIAPGRIDPEGWIHVSKETFGANAGLGVPVYMDGSRYRFVERT